MIQRRSQGERKDIKLESRRRWNSSFFVILNPPDIVSFSFLPLTPVAPPIHFFGLSYLISDLF